MNDPVKPHLPWTRLVELANQLESVYRTRGEIDAEIAARLARAVLDFQHQLLGDMSKTPRPR